MPSPHHSAASNNDPPPTNTPRWHVLNALLVAASAGVIFLMYHRWGNTTERATYGTSAFRWMMDLWSSARIYGGSAFSLGWFIPGLSLALLWRDRVNLRTLVSRASFTGFALVLMALFVHWMGLRAQQTRLSILALVFLIWAITYYLNGWPTARRTLFPIGLLVFCVPLNFLDVFTFPLQRAAAGVAGVLLSGLGLPILRRGSLLQPEALTPQDVLPAPFDGADAAGGLGILLGLVLFAAFWGAWMRRPLRLRVALVVLAPAVHLIANALRLIIACLLQAAAGESLGQAFYSGGSRYAVLGLGLLLLLAFDKLFRSWKKLRVWQLLQPTPPSIG